MSTIIKRYYFLMSDATKYTYSYLYFLTPDLLTSVNCESKIEPPFFCLPPADFEENLPTM